MRIYNYSFLVILIFLFGCSSKSTNKIVADWNIADLVNDTETGKVILGSPEIITTAIGEAVKFNGDDGIILDSNPLAGLRQFTVEAVIYPDSNGKFEQRFLHFGSISDGRLLFETRVKENGMWYFDGYANSNGSEAALLDSTKLHPTGNWYHTALVFNNGEMFTYVNGEPQLTGNIKFIPFGEGETSIGVRLNKKYWFEGKIRRIRITNKLLNPSEFLKID